MIICGYVDKEDVSEVLAIMKCHIVGERAMFLGKQSRFLQIMTKVERSRLYDKL